MFCHSKHGYYGSYGLRSEDWRRQRRNRSAEQGADRRARRRAAAELGFHEIFHVFVLAGSVAHFVFMLRWVAV